MPSPTSTKSSKDFPVSLGQPGNTKNSNVSKLLDAIGDVVKQSYKTRRCTVDEDPDFQRAPATLNPGFIKETLRKWLKKQSKTIINDILPKHAKLLHLDETDLRTAMSKGDNIPVCPEIFNESEIMERVSDDRSKMRAVFYLALWSCISHTNYILIVSMLGNGAARLQNWANSASSPEIDDIDDIVWNLVWRGILQVFISLGNIFFCKQ